jgi:hypothetical protein
VDSIDMRWHCLLLVVRRAVSGIAISQVGVVTSELVDSSLPELACRHLVLEEHIHLAICSTFWFWQAEVMVDPEKEADTSPEEAWYMSAYIVVQK